MSILLTDTKTGEALNIVPTGRCGEGVYQRFYVEGPRQITARIVKHRSPCAVVSGIFLDPVPVWPEEPGEIAGNADELEKLHALYKDDRPAFYRKVMPRVDTLNEKFTEKDGPAALWHRAWFNAVTLRPRKAAELMQSAGKDPEEADNQLTPAFVSALQRVDRGFTANRWTFGRKVLQRTAEKLR